MVHSKLSQANETNERRGIYRRALIRRQAELLSELKSKRSELVELREPVAEDDQAVVAQESSIAQELTAIEADELSRVNAALLRLRAGTYGVCERCGAPIPSVRLTAIPWAEYCHNCELRNAKTHTH
jgi:DnaK suppressor protein